jgi:hypothetical protein
MTTDSLHLLLLALLLASCGNTVTNDTPPDAATSGPDTSGQPLVCRRLLQCAAIVTPEAIAGLEAGFGAAGSCWESGTTTVKNCTTACRSAFSMLNEQSWSSTPECVCAQDSECEATLRCYFGRCSPREPLLGTWTQDHSGPPSGTVILEFRMLQRFVVNLIMAGPGDGCVTTTTMSGFYAGTSGDVERGSITWMWDGTGGHDGTRTEGCVDSAMNTPLVRVEHPRDSTSSWVIDSSVVPNTLTFAGGNAPRGTFTRK